MSQDLRGTLNFMRFTVPRVDEIIQASHVLNIPLKYSFRDLQMREVLLIEGTHGPGEWAAFTEYPDEVAAVWLCSALEQAFDGGVAVPRGNADRLRVNATFPALDVKDIENWWGLFPGVSSAKVKVGEEPSDFSADLDRIQRIREVIGSHVTLRLDANARWTVEQATQALTSLAEFSIDYVEQPVSSLHEMVELRSRLEGTGIRFAADELIRRDHALDEVIATDAADIAVLKVSPLGGIRPTLELARQAHDAGMEVVISSGLETSVGLSWGARAAAILRAEFGSLPDVGLGTSVFLETDPVTEPLLVSDGSIAVTAPSLDLDAVETVRANPERTQWWHDRLRRCLPRALELLES